MNLADLAYQARREAVTATNLTAVQQSLVFRCCYMLHKQALEIATMKSELEKLRGEPYVSKVAKK
jgi:hypothetical protein